MPTEPAAYPPEPWRLRAVAHLSLWWAEPPPLPEGIRPVRIFGRCLVGAAWVRYLPGGDLAYHEVAALVVVRVGWRLGVTIIRIWVDSPASVAGARQMWAIPKELATFVEDEAVGVARSRFRPRWRLPGRWTARSRTVQSREGGLVVTRMRVRGRITVGRGTWEFKEPLEFMPSGRPWVTVRLDAADVVFGPRQP
jgi:hypothetical protein